MGIAEGGVLKAQMFNLAQRYIKCTNVGFSTSAPLLAIPCSSDTFGEQKK